KAHTGLQWSAMRTTGSPPRGGHDQASVRGGGYGTSSREPMGNCSTCGRASVLPRSGTQSPTWVAEGSDLDCATSSSSLMGEGVCISYSAHSWYTPGELMINGVIHTAHASRTLQSGMRPGRSRDMRENAVMRKVRECTTGGCCHRKGAPQQCAQLASAGWSS